MLMRTLTKTFAIALTAMAVLTLTNCKKETDPSPGEQTDLENLLDGDISVKLDPSGRNALGARLTFSTKESLQSLGRSKG